jgi:hypothetical protein
MLFDALIWCSSLIKEETAKAGEHGSAMLPSR